MNLLLSGIFLQFLRLSKQAQYPYLHPDHWAYNKNLKDPGYDPRKAAQMLDGAGWKVGSDGIREKNGVKLAFSTSTSAGAKTREQGQALLQQNWKEIGAAMEMVAGKAGVAAGVDFSRGMLDQSQRRLEAKGRQVRRLSGSQHP